LDVFVRIQQKRIIILNAEFHDEMVHEIQIEWIKSWRQVYTPDEVRVKLAEKLKDAANHFHQLFLDLGDFQPPIRILCLDRWKLRNSLKSMSTSNSIRKEEYFCEFFIPPADPESLKSQDGKVMHVILKFYSDQIQIRDNDSGASIMEIPLSCITTLEVQPIPEEHKGKFLKGRENFIVLHVTNWKTPILLATDEFAHIHEETGRVMAEMEEHLKILFPKVERDILIRAKFFNGLTTTKKLLLQIKEDTVVTMDVEENILHRRVPVHEICGWTLIIKPTGHEQPITCTSADPQKTDEEKLQDLIGILCTKPSLSDSKSVLNVLKEGDGAKLDDSGSGTEIVDLELSNSGEK